MNIILLTLFFIFTSIGFSWSIPSDPDEQKNEKSAPQEQHPEQQFSPYPFMPPIYQTLDMFQKALETMDNKMLLPRKEESKVKVGGYIQTKFQATGFSNEFSISRARGKIFGDIADEISYQLMIDAVSGNILKDAYADFDLYPALKFRIGQFKIPFGLEGVESSTTILTINRSLVTTGLYHGRDIGLRVSGESGNGKFVYAMVIFNGSGSNVADRDTYKDVAGRFGINIINSVNLGMSGQFGIFYNSLVRDYQNKYRIGIDMNYTTNYLKLQSEYIQGKGDISPLEVFDAANGWYILCSSNKYFYPFEYLVRYEYWNRSIGFDNSIKQTTIGLSYYFIADTRLMLNYEMKNLISGDNTFLVVFQLTF